MAAFPILPPAFVPEGDTITSIVLPSDAAKLGVRNVQIFLRGPDGGLVLTEQDVKSTLPPEFTLVPSTGSTPIWSAKANGGTTFTAFHAAGRGYSVIISPQSKVSDADALHVLESTLPAD